MAATSPAVAGRNDAESQAVPRPGVREVPAHRVLEARQVATVAGGRRDHGADHAACREERGDAGGHAVVATQHAIEQRTPGQGDGEVVGEAGQLGRWRLGRRDDEERVRQPTLALRLARHAGTTRSSRRRSHRCRWPGSPARPWRVPTRPGRHRFPGRWPPAPRGRPGRLLSRRPRPWNVDPPRVACPRVYTRARDLCPDPADRIGRVLDRHPAARDDRHPGRRPARAHARDRGADHGVSRRRPRPGSRLPGSGDRGRGGSRHI